MEGHIVILYPPGSGRGLAFHIILKISAREEPFKVSFFFFSRQNLL